MKNKNKTTDRCYKPNSKILFSLLITIFTDQPIDKAPVERTPGEQVLQQHTKTAKTLLGDFNLNEAGKLVQKRRPAASILDEEMLLSEDEAENPPAAKKPIAETEAKETKPAPANTIEKPQQIDKSNMNKPINKRLSGNLGANDQGGIQMKRKKIINRSPSNSRPNNNGPMNMNMNQLNQQMQDSMPRDAGDLFMRKRNFMESDMGGGGFDRPPVDRGFNMGGSNFMNERNLNLNNPMNSNNYGNNRDFGDEFSRRPPKNDGGFNNFGNRSGANGGGGGSGGGGGGRMFNRY